MPAEARTVMDLREFVRETLVQIVEGVVDARDPIVEKGGDINPVGGHFDQTNLGARQWDWDRGAAEVVEFDLALTTSDKEDAKAGIGVFLGGIGIGSKISGENAYSSMTRVKFSVPLLLPAQRVLKQS